MQIMVIWKTKSDVPMKEVQKYLEEEEHFAWKEYIKGNLRQFWTTETPGVIVMIMEFDSIEQAKSANKELPLLKAGLMDAEWYELRPFESWEFLFKEQHQIALSKN